VIGGGDTLDFSGGSNDAASLYTTAGDWDGVTAAAGLIYLTSAQASISGGGDTIDFADGSETPRASMARPTSGTPSTVRAD
jgi:hypothetical protein